jgi:hypothetical protein
LSAYELWVGVDNVRDALTRERLFTEAALDIHQNFLMRRVRFVESVLERKIRWTKAVAEMLRKDPARVCGLVRKESTNEGVDRTHKHRLRLARHGDYCPQRRKRGYPEDSTEARLPS